jgi:GMP synthase (glutamine-hydrolysing)
MVSHYDEVFDLPANFEIIAKSDKCKIHGFQLKGKPVFGVQFHPEYPVKTAKKMFDKHFQKSPKDKVYFSDERQGENISHINSKILKNFISLL